MSSGASSSIPWWRSGSQLSWGASAKRTWWSSFPCGSLYSRDQSGPRTAPETRAERDDAAGDQVIAVISLLGFAALSMSVWGHRMFTTGDAENDCFSLRLLVPVGLEYFGGLIATLMGGRCRKRPHSGGCS
jgi:hypothetical protein